MAYRIYGGMICVVHSARFFWKTILILKPYPNWWAMRRNWLQWMCMVYGDNKGIIADCVDEIQAFIDEVIPDEAEKKEADEEFIDVVIPAENYF